MLFSLRLSVFFFSRALSRSRPRAALFRAEREADRGGGVDAVVGGWIGVGGGGGEGDCVRVGQGDARIKHAAVKREARHPRTSSPGEIKTLALVVGKM